MGRGLGMRQGPVEEPESPEQGGGPEEVAWDRVRVLAKRVGWEGEKV